MKYHDEEWEFPYMMTPLYLNFTPDLSSSWFELHLLNKEKILKLHLTNLIIKIAQYSDDKILDLLQDAGIIRNKLKVYSAVTNAQAFKNPRRIWKFHTFGLCKIHLLTTSQEEVPATSPISDAMVKKNADSNLWDLPLCMPSCKPQAWSMIM
jgi:DNA-3-methyladenine glycosylase I